MFVVLYKDQLEVKISVKDTFGIKNLVKKGFTTSKPEEKKVEEKVITKEEKKPTSRKRKTKSDEDLNG